MFQQCWTGGYTTQHAQVFVARMPSVQLAIKPQVSPAVVPRDVKATLIFPMDVKTKYHISFVVSCVVIAIGVLGTLLLVICAWWLYKVLKWRKKIKYKEKFFNRNGGLILEQQLSSSEGNVDKTKLFTSKELEKAIDRYNENRVIGQGGQGIVYKGMLMDGRIVTVKKLKIVGDSKLEQFINEFVILSKINYRNVVKLNDVFWR
uniref:Protein kinase domain-containing protein n=1 Tax=Vitis vinifera TaxID=29760 RepID=A5BMJ6_VITVI|nr:hypothetical protein VITISV_006324 [Vitis vinifera]